MRYLLAIRTLDVEQSRAEKSRAERAEVTEIGRGEFVPNPAEVGCSVPPAQHNGAAAERILKCTFSSFISCDMSNNFVGTLHFDKD